MSDWDGRGLDVLAPAVDLEVALATFERRRRRDHRQRRLALVAVVAVSALLVGLGAVLGGARDDDAVARLGEVAFEPLHAGHVGGVPDGHLAVATDAASFSALWQSMGWQEPVEPPAVDFHRWVVVAFVTSEGDCAAEVVGIDRGDVVDGAARLSPRLGSSSDEPRVCLLYGPRPYARLVAIERRGVEPSFTFQVTPDTAGPPSGQLVHVPVPPASEESRPVASDLAFDVLEVRRAPPSRLGELRVIDDEPHLVSVWGELGLGPSGSVPDVDLDDRAVLVMTTSVGGCEPVLGGFAIDGGALTPTFSALSPPNAGGRCPVGVAVHTVVVVVPRADLSEVAVVQLPGDEVLGIAASSIALELP